MINKPENTFNDSLTVLLKEFLRELGLNEFNIQIDELWIEYNKIAINFHTRIEKHTLVREERKPDEILKQLIDSVYDGPLVSDLIKSHTNEVNKLKAEIEHLKQFETHFNVEMSLRHGKK